MAARVQTRAPAERSRRVPARTERSTGMWIALAVWSASLIGAHVAGRFVNEVHATNVLAPPLFGRFDLRLSLAIVLPVAVAALVVWFAPRMASSLGWGALLAATVVVAAAWALSLATVDGTSALSSPLEDPRDYLATLTRVESPGAFLDGYAEQLPTYSLHAQGHPPGMVLALWTMQRVGLSGAAWAAALVIALGASASAAALVTLRTLAGEQRARRAAPFLALAPAAVWIATSADALFMGVSAWGVALLALGVARRSDRLALAGGLTLGGGLMLSYGVASLAFVAVAVVLAGRRIRPLLVGAAGVMAVLGVFALAGFLWFEGLAASLERYQAGVAGQRPYAFFLVANLAAFGVAVGPAAATALGRLKDVRSWAPVGAALAGVATADLSGFSKGEVERIWLVFVPWVLLACSAFDLRNARGMLGLQAAVGLAVQMGVRTPW